MISKSVRALGIFTIVAMVAVACGGDGSSETTVTTEAVVFGEGTIPEAIPSDLPIPPNSVVGTTLVDKINNRTEFRLTITADFETSIRFFEVGLVNQGYVITSSEGNAAEWTTHFGKGELTGTIFSTPQGATVTTSVMSVNRS